MDIHELMRGFEQLGYATIGHGPKHPFMPNPALQKEIDEFLRKNQALKRDQGYVDFLETYSAASVDWPSEKLIIQIYGFSSEITWEVAHPDESLVDKDGFLDSLR